MRKGNIFAQFPRRCVLKWRRGDGGNCCVDAKDVPQAFVCFRCGVSICLQSIDGGRRTLGTVHHMNVGGRRMRAHLYINASPRWGRGQNVACVIFNSLHGPGPSTFNGHTCDSEIFTRTASAAAATRSTLNIIILVMGMKVWRGAGRRGGRDGPPGRRRGRSYFSPLT